MALIIVKKNLRILFCFGPGRLPSDKKRIEFGFL